MGRGAEILCICTDANGRDGLRIATGTVDRVLQVSRLDEDAQLICIFAIELAHTVPKSVFFVENASKDIWVLGAYDGELFVAPTLLFCPY